MWTCSVDAAGAAIRKIVVGPSRLPLARGKKGIIKLSQSVIIPRIPQKSSNSCRGMDARERGKSQSGERGEGANKAIRASEQWAISDF